MVPFLFPPSYTKREKQTQEPILLPSEIGASPRAKTDTKGDSYSRAGVVSAACNQLPTGTPPPPFTCPAYGRKAPAGATEPPPTSPIYLYHSKAYQFLWLLRGPALWEMWWAGAWGGGTGALATGKQTHHASLGTWGCANILLLQTWEQPGHAGSHGTVMASGRGTPRLLLFHPLPWARMTFSNVRKASPTS